jgi:hypothetical protein
MTLNLIWGIGSPPPYFLLRRRMTSEGDLRITTDLDVRIAYKAPVAVVLPRATMADDIRTTMGGDRRTLLSMAVGASYLVASDDTADGGEPFRFQYQTNPWQPSAQGGENVFAWAVITMSWSAGGTIRVQPIVDGAVADTIVSSITTTAYERQTEAGDVRTTMNGSRRIAYAVTSGSDTLVETIRPVFTLDQQGASLQRVSQTFMVPLVRRVTRDGAEISRYNLRGERIQFLIESTGVLGTGEIMLEGIELIFTPVRKAIYATAEATR